MDTIATVITENLRQVGWDGINSLVTMTNLRSLLHPSENIQEAAEQPTCAQTIQSSFKMSYEAI